VKFGAEVHFDPACTIHIHSVDYGMVTSRKGTEQVVIESTRGQLYVYTR
jgi:hypothetical protein